MNHLRDMFLNIFFAFILIGFAAILHEADPWTSGFDTAFGLVYIFLAAKDFYKYRKNEDKTE